MNYHYIEYMIKERRREEVEALKKARLLKNIECSDRVLNIGLLKRMESAISRKKKIHRAQLGLPEKNYLKIFTAAVKGRSI